MQYPGYSGNREDVQSRSNKLAVAQQWVSEAHKDSGIDSEWGVAVYRSPAVKTLLQRKTAEDAASVEGQHLTKQSLYQLKGTMCNIYNAMESEIEKFTLLC